MYEITRDYIKFGNSRSGQKITKVGFIVSHDTGNKNSTAHNNRSHFNNNQPCASAHTFIDDKFILEIVPLDEKAWHVMYEKPIDNQMFGDDANDIAIGVELCFGDNIDFKEAYNRYVWYHAYLCKKFNLSPTKNIVSHKILDPQRKTDPDNALNRYGINWEQFLMDVNEEFIHWDTSERKLSGLKPNWKDWQWKEAAEIYKKAHTNGMLTSLDWSDKAKNKELTFDDIEYLNLVINGRKL